MKIGLVTMGLNTVDNNRGAPGTWNQYVQDQLKGDYRRVDLKKTAHIQELQKVLKCLIPDAVKKYDSIIYVDCRRFGDPDHDPSLRSHRGTHPATLQGFLRQHGSSTWFFKMVTKEVLEASKRADNVMFVLACKKGRHRSVAASYLFGAFADPLGWTVEGHNLADGSGRLCPMSCPECFHTSDHAVKIATEVCTNAVEKWNQGWEALDNKEPLHSS